MSPSNTKKNFISLDNPKVSANVGLATKFFTKRALNIDAIVRAFKLIWRTYKDFHIKVVGNQVLLLNFELDTDADCVLLNEPWSFDRYLILFTRHIKGESDGLGLLRTVNFWVQIHNLPF